MAHYSPATFVSVPHTLPCNYYAIATVNLVRVVEVFLHYLQYVVDIIFKK